MILGSICSGSCQELVPDEIFVCGGEYPVTGGRHVIHHPGGTCHYHGSCALCDRPALTKEINKVMYSGDSLTVFFPFEPRAKGRPRFTRRGFAYTPKETRAAELLIADYARDEFSAMGVQPLQGPVMVEFTFRMPIARSLSKPKREALLGKWHVIKPDLDNIEKLVKDALNGIAWIDDSQVCKVVKQKLYEDERSPVGTTVTISPL